MIFRGVSIRELACPRYAEPLILRSTAQDNDLREERTENVGGVSQFREEEGSGENITEEWLENGGKPLTDS